MVFNAFAYLFIFIAIFFESFILVSLLSKPAREIRKRKTTTKTPSVAIIVPCYNEAQTVGATVESLLALDYPKNKVEIILVNDGSIDDTRTVLDGFADQKNIRIIHKENGGKYTALNAGIAATNAEFIGCLDADSFVDKNALREIISCFKNPKVAATTAAMSIFHPRNILEHMQYAEYLFGITFRHAISTVDGQYVTPGPFSFYRRSVLEELHGFTFGHQTEDMEMALRIQKAGYTIENAPRARVYTKAPRSLRALIKQRTRWTTGTIRNLLGEHRDLLGNSTHPALGWIILPLSLFSIVGSITLFAFTIVGLIERLATSVVIHSGVPLSYALQMHGPLGFFTIPISFIWVLAMVTLVISLALILYGKYISKTPGRSFFGLIAYTILYGFVVPLWLIRATVDVTVGKHRAWR